jgi:hypothetical protein
MCSFEGRIALATNIKHAGSSGMAQITDKGYLIRLIEQRDFLQSEIAEYGKGQVHFAYKIAATLRTIFHKTQQSTPILPDLAEKYGVRFSFKGHADGQVDEYVVSYVGFQVGNWPPNFDAFHYVQRSFAQYWNEIIYVEGKIRLTRKQLVLFAANRLGGTHVDPEIPANLLPAIQGNVKLYSIQLGEENIITRAVAETGYQVLLILNTLIPQLERKILPPTS